MKGFETKSKAYTRETFTTYHQENIPPPLHFLNLFAIWIIFFFYVTQLALCLGLVEGCVDFYP